MQVFRTLFRRSGKIAAIIAVTGTVLVFGHTMTPRPNDALADVYLSVGDALSRPGVPAFLKATVQEGDVQQVYLNGNTMYYTQYRTDKDIDTLLDYYEGMYGADRTIVDPKAKEALLQYAQPKDRAEHARRIDETERLANQRHVRFEGKGWGGFATMVTGHEGKADWSQDMKKRFGRFQETGRVTELGDPKIVVAFDDKAMGGTQYFNVWHDEAFNQRSLRPRKAEDTAGYDIEDIPRPHGSFRVITFGQDHGGTDYSILVYRGPGTIGGVEDHFLHSMQDEGWGVSDRWMDAREKADDPVPSLLFAKDGREAYVSLAPTAEGTVTTTIVVSKRG
jgi:hypothetical protein